MTTYRTVRGWHFTDGMKLRDGRKLVVGKTYTHDGDLVLCESGLHASVKALDALTYAPGSTVSRVEMSGEIVHSNDKLIARERTVLWAYDATNVLRRFARLCALDVIHLWDAPDAVVRYLRTGDESIRLTAVAAALDAAGGAALDAARAARAARAAALDAARAAALDAAGDAALAATWDAARDAQNKRLHRMLMEGRP